jgi:acyl-CoA reductase-like NAD-dependent aldehyde dehydrogenase
MENRKQPKTGMTNVNQLPGYRPELTPFRGTRDSGLAMKEGGIEAIKFFTRGKTWPLPW